MPERQDLRTEAKYISFGEIYPHDDKKYFIMAEMWECIYYSRYYSFMLGKCFECGDDYPYYRFKWKTIDEPSSIYCARCDHFHQIASYRN